MEKSQNIMELIAGQFSGSNLQKWKRNSSKFMMFIKKHKKEERLEVLEELSYADSSLNPSLIHDKKVLVIP